MILFLIFFLAACAVLIIAINEILLKGKEEYLIIFMCLYLPFYTTILSLVFQQTGSALLVSLFQLSKELIVLIAIISFLLFKRDFFSLRFRLVFIDYVFLAFLGLGLLYVFLPMGSAGLLQKLMYYKNIAILGIMYFFGRNAKLVDVKLGTITNIILGIAVLAFLLNLYEYFTYTHFQSLNGFAGFNEAINKKDPEGSYYLNWTFETQSGSKRFASFFSGPLELAAAVLLAFPLALILYMREKYPVHKYIYLIIMACVITSLVLSFSRAALAALFIQLFFLAFVFRLYRLIFVGIVLGIGAVAYVVFWASKDFQDFIYDTITFQNSSSIGHLIEWFQGIESMIANPQGIGLAMSGNASSVDDAVKVGGENQFIIFGVQLGVFGLFLYCLLLFLSITYSLKAYRFSRNTEDAIIPFVAASVKVGLLLPLFTSNAEIFLYIAFVSWWMVGYSVSTLERRKKMLFQRMNTVRI
ncbi:MAG: O-antigen ligase domain-containing protein [Imperialibacter sp.]|uniref:O-antigen ligase domain-containing protein n=1 Tax=Imperialibacter sp. TaxID=2038411 RepID=UPI003A83E271